MELKKRYLLLQNGGKTEPAHTVVISHAFQQVNKSEIKFINSFVFYRLTVMVGTKVILLLFRQNGIYLKKGELKIYFWSLSGQKKIDYIVQDCILSVPATGKCIQNNF